MPQSTNNKIRVTADHIDRLIHEILVGYAQTAAVGSVLLIGSTIYTELSGRSGRLSFDREVCLFVGCLLALRC